MSERELGRIIRLQVQRDSLKVKGVRYDPSGILAVDEASLDAQGMIGRHADAWVVDAHHAAHPKTRAGGRRALSIGFVGHYEAMATRFGSAQIGCAGSLLGGAVVAIADIWVDRSTALRWPFFVAGAVYIGVFFYALPRLSTAKLEATRAAGIDAKEPFDVDDARDEITEAG